MGNFCNAADFTLYLLIPEFVTFMETEPAKIF